VDPMVLVGGAVVIGGLAWFAYRRSSGKKLQHVVTASEAMDQFMSDATELNLRNLKSASNPNSEMRALLLAAIDENSAEVDALTAKMHQETRVKLQSQLEALWDAFDKDGSGALDAEENRALTKAYLSKMVSAVEVNVDEALQIAAESIILSMEIIQRRETKDPSFELDTASKAAVISNAMATKAITVRGMRAVFQSLSEESDALADQAFAQMDMNKDGEVEKQEFVATFLDAMTDLIGPKATIPRMEKWFKSL